MNMRQWVGIFFFSFSWRSYAQNFKTWAEKEWTKIPTTQQVSLPGFKFDINEFDKEWLSIKKEAVQRNEYINSSYFYLGESLSRCLGVEGEIANWYHFANWASKSAGEILTKEKFL